MHHQSVFNNLVFNTISFSRTSFSTAEGEKRGAERYIGFIRLHRSGGSSIKVKDPYTEPGYVRLVQ